MSNERIINTYAEFLSDTEKEKFDPKANEADFLNKAQVGDFLLRPSSKGSNYFTAVVKQNSQEPLFIRYEIKNGAVYAEGEEGMLRISISDHIAVRWKLNQLSEIEKRKFHYNAAIARQKVDESFAGDFPLFPSSQGENFITAAIKEPQGTINNIRFEFKDGKIFDKDDKEVQSIAEYLRANNQNKKFKMLSPEDQKKFVDPKAVISKLATMQEGDCIISFPLYKIPTWNQAPSLEVIVKTNNGTEHFYYECKGDKKFYQQNEITGSIAQHAINRYQFSKQLFEAIEKSNFDFIKSIPEFSEDLDMKNDQGETPLNVAAKLGNTDMIQVLVKRGANLNEVLNAKTTLEIFKENNHDDAEIEALLSYTPNILGQKWFIDLMKAMGYPGKSKGFCYAVQTTGRAGILTELSNPRGLSDFNMRFRELGQLIPDNIQKKIEKVKEKYLALVAAEKTQLVAKWEQEEGHLPLEQKLSEKEKNIRLQAISENVRKKLPLKEQVLLDSSAFFDSLEIHQEITELKELVKGKKIYSLQKKYELAKELVTPVELEKLGGELKVGSFSGAYSESDLQSYFESLKKQMIAAKNSTPPFNQPISLEFSSSNHSINVGYNPVKDRWTFIDANNLPAKFIRSEAELVKLVSQAFATSAHTVMATKVFIAKNPNKELDLNKVKEHEANFRKHYSAWQASVEYKNIHQVTPEKVKVVDKNQVSWLHIAAKYSDNKKVKELIRNGADINLKTKDSSEKFNNKTPLDMAEHGENSEAAKLLRKGNAFTRNWKMSLFYAITSGLIIAGGIAATVFIPPLGIGIIATGVVFAGSGVVMIKKMDDYDVAESFKRTKSKEAHTSFVESEKPSAVNETTTKHESSTGFVLGKVGNSKQYANDTKINIVEQNTASKAKTPATNAKVEVREMREAVHESVVSAPKRKR